MKLLSIIVLTTLLVATASTAQIPGKIAVYADMAGTDCDIVDEGGLLEVHVLHVMTDGARASRFALDASATSWIPLGDNWEFEFVLGSSAEGVSISYQNCLTGSIYLGVALFLGSSTPACTEISVVPDPTALSGKIEAVDCTYDVRMFPGGGVAVVNADQTCQCTVPAAETTWGGIKELYR
jgi:hypothetical protein